MWVGKGSSPKERRSGIIYAQKYLVDFNRPKALPIHRILEGNNLFFYQNFLHAKLNCDAGGENEVFETAFKIF